MSGPGCEQHRCSPLQDGRRLGPASRTPLPLSGPRAGLLSQGKGRHRRCRHVSACLTSKPYGTDVGLELGYATTPRAVTFQGDFTSLPLVAEFRDSRIRIVDLRERGTDSFCPFTLKRRA